jgi:hypothetical protein
MEALKGKKLHKTFIIRASGEAFITGKKYWMILEANANCKLSSLDGFLRRKWMECCGHLSMFKIDGVRYYVDEYFTDPFDHSEKRMHYRLDRVLYQGCKFSYEYDFGTTSEVALRVLKETEGAEMAISILARNNPPKFTCEDCKKETATHLCSECFWDDRKAALLCKQCSTKHRRHSLQHMLNSPRVGMCGPLSIDEE